MNFWERVDIIIDRTGKSRKELASAAGFDVSNIGKGIKANNLPNVETAVRIAKFLGTSVEYLVTGKEDGKPEKLNLDELLKYSNVISALEQIPNEQRKILEKAIFELSESFEKDDKNGCILVAENQS